MGGLLFVAITRLLFVVFGFLGLIICHVAIAIAAIRQFKIEEAELRIAFREFQFRHRVLGRFVQRLLVAIEHYFQNPARLTAAR